MEKSSKRGKIPQQDWPSIISRYEAGETLASIARTYDCSPPAISYIVSRTRARNATTEDAGSKAPATAEPQLVKISPSSMPAADSTHPGTAAGESGPSTTTVIAAEVVEPSIAAPPPSRSELSGQVAVGEAQQSPEVTGATHREFRPEREGRPDGDAAAAHAAIPPDGSRHNNGEGRRTLHLSLSQGNGAGPAAASPPSGAGHTGNGHGVDGRLGARPQAAQSGFGPQPRQSVGPTLPLDPAPNPLGAVRAPAVIPDGSQKTKDGSAFIDHALRERIDGDIAAFLSAFDAALDRDTAENRTRLREATDRLLRAGARTRIELERLEARVPLASREQAPMSLFRPR
jgi:hypothetical protein